MSKFFENLIYSESIRSIIIKVILSIIVFLVAKIIIYIFTKALTNLVKTYKSNDFRNSKKVSVILMSLSTFIGKGNKQITYIQTNGIN